MSGLTAYNARLIFAFCKGLKQIILAENRFHEYVFISKFVLQNNKKRMTSIRLAYFMQ